MYRNITIGDATVWDFGFRYNLPVMDLDELEVIMLKYEVELKRSAQDGDRYWEVTGILGKIYREIMKRKMKEKINNIEKSDHEKVFCTIQDKPGKKQSTGRASISCFNL